MEKMVIHKNKGETLKCNLEIEGAKLDEVSIRLCLEFGDNRNMFFYGELSPSGECIINIPRMPELDNKSGKMVVEAIANSTYFKVYECDVELKNSLEVTMKESFFGKKTGETTIQLAEIEKVKPPVEKVQESTESPKNPFLTRSPIKKKFGDNIFKGLKNKPAI